MYLWFFKKFYQVEAEQQKLQDMNQEHTQNLLVRINS